MPVARRVKKLRARDRGDIRQEIERILGIDRSVLRAIDRRPQQRTLLAGEIGELLIVDPAIDHVDARHQPVAEAIDHAVIDRSHERAIVLIVIIKPLEDRVHQMAIDPERTELHRRIIEPHRGLVTYTHGIDISLPSPVMLSQRRSR